MRLVVAQEPHPARRLAARAATTNRPTPTVVGIDFRTDAAVDRDPTDVLVDRLADAAQEVFPDWYAGIDTRFDLTRYPQAEREIRLREAARRYPEVSGSWLRASWSRARRSRSVRLTRYTRREEARQLALAIDPERLLVIISVDPGDGSTPEPVLVARSAEWLALQTRAPVFLFVPQAWDREHGLDSVMDDRFDLPADVVSVRADPPPSKESVPAVAVLVDPPVGRPHGGSGVELALYQAIQRSPDLAQLFRFNQQIPLNPACTPRVDLLWPEGRVVVEVDGPGHREAAHYRADRSTDPETGTLSLEDDRL